MTGFLFKDCHFYIPKTSMESEYEVSLRDPSENHVGGCLSNIFSCFSFCVPTQEDSNNARTYDMYVRELIDEEHTFYARDYSNWSDHGEHDDFDYEDDDDESSPEEIF